MHELSLAQEAIRLVVQDASRRGLKRVTLVKILVGEWTAVLPEAFRLAFECASRGTIVEGARLEIEEAPARALCCTCGLEFHPKEWFLLCPRCSTPGAQLLSGREMQIVSYEGSLALEKAQ
ncbi:hydrogenase nickel incorporation protein HypA/HybF [Thermanaeromonas toyohensis ToBE]|uniref:Hydrogenase maturation factor HypA n=1 Tax=Thermanaeromonas toyohensis ToBE TaxID=698762 RepID=A0A1W1VZW8_9FIRM|nr:hydrogenase maturation nickel metallochaperone HypA [Thermanaeromonas toyohensis]SMB98888.1 hydrogenase nickel incorporation protein HypA/HybF [Thermanaeromonas toyohensis ToBE]